MRIMRWFCFRTSLNWARPIPPCHGVGCGGRWASLGVRGAVLRRRGAEPHLGAESGSWACSSLRGVVVRWLLANAQLASGCNSVPHIAECRLPAACRNGASRRKPSAPTEARDGRSCRSPPVPALARKGGNALSSGDRRIFFAVPPRSPSIHKENQEYGKRGVLGWGSSMGIGGNGGNGGNGERKSVLLLELRPFPSLGTGAGTFPPKGE